MSRHLALCGGAIERPPSGDRASQRHDHAVVVPDSHRRHRPIPDPARPRAAVDWYILKFSTGDINARVAVATMGRAIFSLSLGGTFMVACGSYLAVLTALGDTMAGLLAGLAIPLLSTGPASPSPPLSSRSPPGGSPPKSSSSPPSAECRVPSAECRARTLVSASPETNAWCPNPPHAG